MRSRGRRATVAGIGAALLALASAASAQPTHSAGYAWDEPEWRFTHHDRPVKVVLLAGSIGAFRNRPYGVLIHNSCANAEVRNLSQVGAGAPQLYSRFQHEVIENPNVPRGARGLELWLLFGGGLNSVGAVTRTNFAMNRLFVMAHHHGIRVAALTLTPWGDSGEDDERWRDGRALHALRSTRRVVDYVLGRSSPTDALGPFASRRPRGVAASAPWTAAERPDVAIDLYDAPALRDAAATPWTIEDAQRRIERDSRWRTETASLSQAARDARLAEDARFLADAPRHFLRAEFRSFDHIHPNREGHQAMFDTMCPRLPASWGCRCP